MKDKILKILEEHQGETVSGNAISETLGITRSAVWKAIASLKKQGYNIEGVTNKGYCLTEENDIISQVGIQKWLQTKKLGRDIQVHDTLSSTNTYAKELATNGASEGMLIVARQQQQGKGRLGKQFYSPKGAGIYFSLILKPEMSSQESVFITVAAAVAVCRAIEKLTGIHALIKWVNDIFVNDKKLCGILTEATFEIESGALSSVILGIGINFSSPIGGYPEDIAHIATSLSKCNPNRICYKNQLIAEVINQFEPLYDALGQKEYLAEYKSRSCIIGNEIEVLKNDESKIYTAVDIDDNARLIVEDKTGNRTMLHSGEISIRRKI